MKKVSKELVERADLIWRSYKGTWVESLQHTLNKLAEECLITINEDIVEVEQNIIGYKAKSKYFYTQYCALVKNNVSLWESKLDFLINSANHTHMIEAGVLDLWFDKVYQPKELSINDKLIKVLSDFNLSDIAMDIYINKIKAIFKK